MHIKRGIAAIAALGLSAQLHAAGIDLAAMAQLHKDGVVETPAIVFAAPQGARPLDLTLYQPAHASGLLPLVMFVHGGGWGGDPFHPLAGVAENQASAADNDGTFFALARRGYVVANVTYRLSGEAKFPAQIQDVKAAVRFLRTHAGEFGADPNRIVAWGASAGGYLVSLLGTSCGAAALEPVAGGSPGGAPMPAAPVASGAVSDCVNAVVDWYGPIDFGSLDTMAALNHGVVGINPGVHGVPNSPESTLLGCDLPMCSAALMHEASALSYVGPQNPPFLIMHGLADGAVPHQQSELLAARLKAAGVKVTLQEVPGAGHLFMGIPKAASDQLTQQTFAWLDQETKTR